MSVAVEVNVFVLEDKDPDSDVRNSNILGASKNILFSANATISGKAS